MSRSKEAVSSVLIAEREKVQMPIYFVSKALQAHEMNYKPIEKLVYCLVHSTRRLRKYYHAHPIKVITNKPIKQILVKPETSGGLAKWAIELGEHEISLEPRNAVKGQILADVLVEVFGERTEQFNEVEKPQTWELYTDGASSIDGAGASLILINLEGEEHTYALKFSFYASNNEAEYEALLSGMRIAIEMGIETLRAHVDSQLLAQELFEAREQSMKKYLEIVQSLAGKFDSFEIS
ncbi:uncharacterized protein [Rutidosis leptorrhynchoides]|uniref:uncharacterized protein n=1 Tax=Rutidosis leptorrhynchoides TaxID=125765 RepID=UPI003A9A46AE